MQLFGVLLWQVISDLEFYADVVARPASELSRTTNVHNAWCWGKAKQLVTNLL